MQRVLLSELKMRFLPCHSAALFSGKHVVIIVTLQLCVVIVRISSKLLPCPFRIRSRGQSLVDGLPNRGRRCRILTSDQLSIYDDMGLMI